MFDKIVEIGLLFDFYGRLLSERQYLAVELYYIHDLSLSEIGEQLKISRQSVHDTLKRAESHLYSYEEKLGLVNKFRQQDEKVESISKLIDSIMKVGRYDLSNSVCLELKEIKKIVEEIRESGQEGK